MLNLSGLWKSRLMFPELSDSEFQILMHYAQGTSIHCIADIMKCSLAAVKQSLQRTRNKFALDKLESVRGIYNARVQAALVSTDDFPINYFEVMQKHISNTVIKETSP